MASLHLAEAGTGQLRLCASTGLPSPWVSAVDRVPAGPGGLPYGAAAAGRRPVVVADFRTPEWQPYRALLAQCPISEMRVYPLLGGEGEVLGVFAVYFERAGEVGETPPTGAGVWGAGAAAGAIFTPYGARAGFAPPLSGPSFFMGERRRPARGAAGARLGTGQLPAGSGAGPAGIDGERVARHLARMVELGRYHWFPGAPAGVDAGPGSSCYPYGLIQGMLTALEVRDAETVGHSRRVTTYMLLLAERMGFDRSQFPELALGAALHDVGKIGVPDRVLRKPGRLNPEEMDVVRRHPRVGAEMLEELEPYFPRAVELVRYHHERWDGKGYPDGLKGEEIPLLARMFAVVDAFDAMTSDRPYRAARDVEEARWELLRQRGTQLCPACVDAFLGMDRALIEAVRTGVIDYASGYLPMP